MYTFSYMSFRFLLCILFIHINNRAPTSLLQICFVIYIAFKSSKKYPIIQQHKVHANRWPRAEKLKRDTRAFTPLPFSTPSSISLFPNRFPNWHAQLNFIRRTDKVLSLWKGILSRFKRSLSCEWRYLLIHLRVNHLTDNRRTWPQANKTFHSNKDHTSKD